MMKLYAGTDLHSNNSVIELLDEKDKVIYDKRLPNELPTIFRSKVESDETKWQI